MLGKTKSSIGVNFTLTTGIIYIGFSIFNRYCTDCETVRDRERRREGMKSSVLIFSVLVG
jgi:hypothetical protein